MSNVVTAIAKRKKVGSSIRKAVLMYMADNASEDGSGIWTSKANMSADLEMSKRSVQSHITAMVADGLISAVGKRSCKSGYTYEYRINLGALKSLPSTRAGDSPVQEIHGGGGAGDSPQGVQEIHPNHPLTTHEPFNRERSAREDYLSEGFAAYNEFAELHSWPICQKVTKARASRMKARIADAGGLIGWRDGLEKAAKSDFLCGRVNGFKISIDFLLQESSFTKLMEGNYDNRNNDSGNGNFSGKACTASRQRGASMASVVAEREREREIRGGSD